MMLPHAQALHRFTMLPMLARLAACLIVPALTSGCAYMQPDAGGPGSRQTHRLQLAPEQAARCIARNAEAHSGALVAEVRASRDAAQVIVRVRNGAFYASADLERTGAGSSALIVHNVRSTGRGDDLHSILVRGC